MEIATGRSVDIGWDEGSRRSVLMGDSHKFGRKEELFERSVRLENVEKRVLRKLCQTRRRTANDTSCVGATMMQCIILMPGNCCLDYCLGILMSLILS